MCAVCFCDLLQMYMYAWLKDNFTSFLAICDKYRLLNYPIEKVSGKTVIKQWFPMFSIGIPMHFVKVTVFPLKGNGI